MPPKAFWEDYAWAVEHYPYFLQNYANRWIGIYGKRVVAASASLGSLEDSLGDRFSDRPVPMIFVADAPQSIQKIKLEMRMHTAPELQRSFEKLCGLSDSSAPLSNVPHVPMSPAGPLLTPQQESASA